MLSTAVHTTFSLLAELETGHDRNVEHGRLRLMIIYPPHLAPWKVVVDFAKGASGFRLFAAIVGNDLVITSNPAKFASPVGDRFQL